MPLTIPAGRRECHCRGRLGLGQSYGPGPRTPRPVMLLEPPATPYDLRFQLFGTPVRVHPLFWLVSAILGWPFIEAGLIYLALWVFCSFLSILLHEFGHIWMGKLFGSDGYIVLYSF